MFRIKKIENIGHLVNLDELFIGKNKIRQLEGVETLQKLSVLSLPGNRIVKIENVEQLNNLKELYLSDQGLQDIHGVEPLVKSNSKYTEKWVFFAD